MGWGPYLFESREREGFDGERQKPDMALLVLDAGQHAMFHITSMH
jgi:hypothetical protein